MFKRHFGIDILAAIAALMTTNGTALAADSTPPTVTAPVQTFAKGKVTSTVPPTVPVNIKWSADDASGIKSCELWRSTNSGPYVRVALATPTTTSQTYRLAADNSYRFFVRAYDNAGNASAAKYGPTFTPHVIDDRFCCHYSTLIWYEPWTKETSSLAYNGTLTKLYSWVGSTRWNTGVAFYDFTGRDVAYVAVVGSGWSSAKVEIDGLFYRTAYLNSFPDGGAQIVVSKHWGTLAAHTIEVRTGSSFGYINVDAFVVNQ
jgi:hypothetical protein